MVLCDLVAKHRVTFHTVIAAFKAELDPLQVGHMHHGFRVKRYAIKKYFLSHCRVPCSVGMNFCCCCSVTKSCLTL